MYKQNAAISVLFTGTQRKLWVALFVFICLFSALSPLLSQKTEAATSSTINFQARLLQANGAVVADGYYNVEFKLYNVDTAGSALWTETRYDSNGVTAGSDARVRVVNGYLTVNLGSVTAFPAINWDQELWLTMNIGGTAQTASPTWDGEMNPRLKFTASPYAFAAGKLQTSGGGNTSTLGFASQTASRSLLLPDESGTVCVQSAASCGFAASSGSGSYIQNGISPQAANFNITGSGTADLLSVGSAAAIGNTATLANTGLARATLHVNQSYASLVGIDAVSGIVNNISVNTGVTTSADIAGASTYVSTDGAADYANVYGNKNLVSHAGSSSVFQAIGADNVVHLGGEGSITDGIATQGIVASFDGMINNASALVGSVIAFDGDVDVAKGVVSSVSNFGSGTIDTGYGLYVNQAVNLGSGSFNNNYGVYIEDQSGTGSVNSYNLYSAGATAKNYIGGSLQVGSTGTAGRLNIGTNSDTAAAGGIAFGTDTNLYRGGANLLATDDAFQSSNYISAYDGTANQVTLGRTAVGVAGPGVAFGSGQDVNLYRSAADTLKTDDAFVVAGAFSVTSTANSYIMGALGLGTASPQTGSALTIANATWISALDAAGTGYVNLFQVNAANEIQVGAAMNVDGGIILPTNGGQLTLVDLPIDTTSTAGTVHGYTMRVGTTNALTIYGQSDGAGGAQNVRVAIGSSITPAYALDVTGDVNISSGSSFRVNTVPVCNSGGCTAASGSANYIQNGTGQQASSNFNISGAGVIGTTLAVNGTALTTTSTTMSLFNTGATTLNLAGAATTINVGAAAGTATFNGKVSIGAGSVAARLAVTATNNSDAAFWAQTTNGAGYGAALRAGTASVDYLNISNFGKWVVKSPSGADSADQYLFQDSGSANIIGFNAQSKRVFINSTAVAASAHALYVNGDTNLSSGSVYRINGTQISSANLSNDSSLAKLNGTNTLTASSAFIVTNGGGTNALSVDTTNGRVGIQTTGAPGNYALDVGSIFQVDKTNNRVIVGTWGGDTSGTITVLGTKTTAGDPTGVVGAMYYNSNLGAFRCYTVVGWQSCGPQTKKLGADASNTTTTMGDVSGLSFAVLANTDYVLSCTLMYTSASTTAGLGISLNGPSSPTAISAIVNAYSGTDVNVSAGYGFRLYDGGQGIPDTSNNFSSYPATLNATFRNGANAGNLTVRLKTLTAGQAATIKEGSSCQLTPL